MLEGIESQDGYRQVYRLASIPAVDALIAELSLDTQSEDELRALLADRRWGTEPNELLDGPFRTKHSYRRRTRYSDGSFPVFYSSLEIATAHEEVRYRLSMHGGSPAKQRRAYFQQFRCTFHGKEKDLRPRLKDWPDLVHGCDYSLCNQLGAEAYRIGLDGLIAPSARCKGANQPILRRSAIDKPVLDALVAISVGPRSVRVTE